jgi:hypothetical protein
LHRRDIAVTERGVVDEGEIEQVGVAGRRTTIAWASAQTTTSSVCAIIRIAAVAIITATKCDLGRAVCRDPAERAMPTAPMVTSAWIIMLITLTTPPTRN